MLSDQPENPARSAQLVGPSQFAAFPDSRSVLRSPEDAGRPPTRKAHPNPRESLTTTHLSGIVWTMDQLTPAQVRVLDAIRGRLEAGDAPPTYRELQEELGFRSTASIRDHLRALERKGFLTLGHGRFRSLRLSQERAQSVRVPILGSIAAGCPTPTQEALEGYVELPAQWIRGDSFALRVVGDSMREAGILPGDTALIRRDIVPRTGQVVCATVDGDTTLKTLELRSDGHWLVPANPRYRPRKLGPDSILQGVLQVVFRHYRQAQQSRALTL